MMRAVAVTILVVLAPMLDRRSSVAAPADPGREVAATSQPIAQPRKRRPQDWSVEELRSFRGAISTVRLDIPLGPRPGKPDNALFTAMYGCYSTADRARMRAAYKQRGYTHWPIGPLITGTYHGKYPDHNELADPNHFENLLEELWNDGLVPVVFLLPLDRRCGLGNDGTIDWQVVERVLRPVYRTARFQRLARVVALAWEPNDGKIISTQSQSAAAVRWMARVFPHALRYIHMTAVQDAPCDQAGAEAAAWRAVAPYLHGWLVQDANFGGPNANGAGLDKFRGHLRSAVAHLHAGRDGWPTTSAIPGQPRDIVAFEYASYWSFWNNRPESEARRWGEAALSIEGIAGFDDGGPGPPPSKR